MDKEGLIVTGKYIASLERQVKAMTELIASQKSEIEKLECIINILKHE